MPTSLNLYDYEYVQLFNKVNPKTILDVGPGYGRMGQMVKNLNIDCKLDAIEIDSTYINQYNLYSIYQTIYNCDVKNFCLEHPRLRYDIVIFNDILEHMFRSEAMDVIDFLLYRTNYIVVQWPTDFVQDDWENHQSEVHRSNFKLLDFCLKGFNVLKYKKIDFHNDGFTMHYCVLNGYKNKNIIDI